MTRKIQPAPETIHLTPVGGQWNNAWVNADPGYNPDVCDVKYIRSDLIKKKPETKESKE